jgi:hypothetical protein
MAAVSQGERADAGTVTCCEGTEAITMSLPSLGIQRAAER